MKRSKEYLLDWPKSSFLQQQGKEKGNERGGNNAKVSSYLPLNLCIKGIYSMHHCTLLFFLPSLFHFKGFHVMNQEIL